MGRQLGLKPLVSPLHRVCLQGQKFWSTVRLCILVSCKVCDEVGSPTSIFSLCSCVAFAALFAASVPAAHDPLTRLRMCERQTRVSLVRRLLQSCTVACVGGLSNLVHCKFCSKRQAPLLEVNALAGIFSLDPFALQACTFSGAAFYIALRPSDTLSVFACCHG